MSGEIEINGLNKRPSWNHLRHSDEFPGFDKANFEMLESVRNVMEGVLLELKKLNVLLHCHNFTAIPFKLDRISRNTAKPRKPKTVRA